eukprot:2599751-Prymnesium_polylepis.1
MVLAANKLLDAAHFDQTTDSEQRHNVAAAGAPLERYGVYGEMSLSGMAELLLHPAIRPAIARDHPRFVDYGSGSGRLLLGVAAMHEWESCAGVEAIEGLHAIACASAARARATGILSSGTVVSLHGNGLPHKAPAAGMIAKADLCFMYSTAFPSEDALRLPEVSASLASTMKKGSVAVTTDTFLVGDRFKFAPPLVLAKGAGGEPIQCFVWRVIGEPAPSYETAYSDVMARWMGDDPCEHNEEACEAIFEALEAMEDDDDKC